MDKKLLTINHALTEFLPIILSIELNLLSFCLLGNTKVEPLIIIIQQICILKPLLKRKEQWKQDVMHVNLNLQHIHWWSVSSNQQIRFILRADRFVIDVSVGFSVHASEFAHWSRLARVDLVRLENMASCVEMGVFH